MIVGIPREIKQAEYRVAVTPAGVAELAAAGCRVLAEERCGAGSGFGDGEYRRAGAEVVAREKVFAEAELIVKVKEPQPEEFPFFREGQALFTYLHLAPNPELVDFLLRRRVTALAYETLEKGGALPLLEPMSEVAGRMAPLAGAWFLQRCRGGEGVLPGGVAGVRPAKCVILGAGTVGSNAARTALGLGMETVVLNRGMERLKRLDELYRGTVRTVALQRDHLVAELAEADVVVGALLVPGGRTPVLVTREMLGGMREGAVIVDVAVDQGGCCETTRPTTHDDPVYEVDGILHYCVANMPGAYPRTSTVALANATLPYVRLLAESGIDGAIAADRSLAGAVALRDGAVVHPALRE